MRIELNIVLKKELGNTNTYEQCDEITMDFNTLCYTKLTEIKHYENDIDLPVFCNSSMLLTNAFENKRIVNLLCKDLINNKMSCSDNDDITFIVRKNVKIVNGYMIDVVMKGTSFRCIAATQGYFFSEYFAKTMGAFITIEKNRIVSFDGNSFCRYINTDIEDAAESKYKYNYDGLIYYDHYLPYNHPLKDLGLTSMKGECVTGAKRVENKGDYRVYHFIYNRRDMVKSLFGRR